MSTASENIDAAVGQINRMMGAMTAVAESATASDSQGVADDLFEAWKASQEVSLHLLRAWAIASTAAVIAKITP